MERKSQQVVRFDGMARGWDVRESADENSPPPHVVCKFPRVRDGPSYVIEKDGTIGPVRCASPEIDVAERVCAVQPRPPLAPSTGGNGTGGPSASGRCEVMVLKRELKALELALAAERRAHQRANKLIDGFCRLRIADRD